MQGWRGGGASEQRNAYMRMIAEPQSVTSRRYAITRDGALICEISFPTFAPSTATPVAGQMYRLRRLGALRERITLETARGMAPVALLSQRDALRRDYDVEAGARRLGLRAESLLRSGYLLLEDERVVGVVRPSGALHRSVTADLPDDLPLEVGVFLLWAVLLLWRGRRVTRA